jgi:hypothetical protein
MHLNLLIMKEKISIDNKLKIMMKMIDTMDICDLYFNSIYIINGR